MALRTLLDTARSVVRALLHLEDHMSTLTTLIAQVRDAYAKELADIDRRLAALQATLEDRALTAEAARDQALAELAAATSDHDAASAELTQLLDQMAANDLPDEPVEPQEPTEPEPEA